MRRLAKRVIPPAVYRPLLRRWRALRKSPVPREGLRGLRPISRIWGLDRGTAIEHHYIRAFLRQYAADVRGHVLEMADRRYTTAFGGDAVTRSDVLHYVAGDPEATLVGDLVSGRGIPAGTFDCLIVTNTFLLIYDVAAAVRTCYRALRPGGVLLAHFTALASRVPRDEAWEGDYWRFTSQSARRLCVEAGFPADTLSVAAYGNVYVAAAMLYGLAAEDLGGVELDHVDPDYETVVCVRAVRPA